LRRVTYEQAYLTVEADDEETAWEKADEEKDMADLQWEDSGPYDDAIEILDVEED
jgi:hypothetical protein